MRRSFSVVLMMLLSLSLTIGCASSADNPARMTDADIKAAVENNFTQWTDYDWSPIHVMVSNGVVTLHGTVETTAQRNAAESAAHAVRDVARVVNEIKVR